MQTRDTSWDISQTEIQRGYGVPRPETSTQDATPARVLLVRIARAKNVLRRLVRSPRIINVLSVVEAIKH